MLKNYYEILQVREDATSEEIKKQFRKLVRMYHPDINSGFEAESMFKTINKAAEVLLDDEKRKNYDSLRNIDSNINTNKQQYTFQDFFKEKKTNKNTAPMPKNGEDITVNVNVDLFEAAVGTTRTVNIAYSKICPKCQGHKFANGKKCNFCNGQGEIEDIKKITVKIPPSVKNKAKLRIKGEGKKGLNGGENGNLYVVVDIKENDEFKIKDNIVYSIAYISPYRAVLGGNVKVSTLWGEITIKIPPLTKANQSFKLIDVGVADKTGKKGEQIVQIQIQTPVSISKEEKELYKRLEEISLKKKNARAV